MQLAAGLLLLLLIVGAVALGRHCDKKRADNEKQERIAWAREQDRIAREKALAPLARFRPCRRVRY